jgi:hypothetical protein
MENLFPTFTWERLFLMVIILLALYFIIMLLERRLRYWGFPLTLKLAAPLGRFVTILYEPIAMLIFIGGFFLIRPIYHGLLLIALFALGYNHLRNYLSGRIILLGGGWQVGKQVEAGAVKGLIARLGRLGVYLQDTKGQHFINYAKLLTDGYTLSTDEEAGGLYNLLISQPNMDSFNPQKLMDLLVKAPYIDWNHRPALSAIDQQQTQLKAQVFLKEDKQLPDLISLIKEWGYQCIVE